MRQLDTNPQGLDGRDLQEAMLEAAIDLLRCSVRNFSPPGPTREAARTQAREHARMLIDRLRAATLEEIPVPEVLRPGHSAVCRWGRLLSPIGTPLELAFVPELGETVQNQIDAAHGLIEQSLYRHTHLFRGSQTWLIDKLAQAAGPEVESVAFRFPETVPSIRAVLDVAAVAVSQGPTAVSASADVAAVGKRRKPERVARIGKYLKRVNRYRRRPEPDGKPERATKKTMAETLGYADDSPIMRWQQGENNSKIEDMLDHTSPEEFWKKVIARRATSPTLTRHGGV
jgi:hypothetical protein